MVEWSPTDLIGEETGQFIKLSRDQDENEASAQLSLIPGISYRVQGFGLLEGERLHTFPITLPGNLVILSTSAGTCVFPAYTNRECLAQKGNSSWFKMKCVH